ncbi:unnamed protein product, partial [Mesorhabditis spiculigera]
MRNVSTDVICNWADGTEEALANMAAYSIVCACTMYAIPGYYLTYAPGNTDVTQIFTISGNILKGGMFALVLATDAVIVWKLYQMNVLGTKKLKSERSSRTTTLENGRAQKITVELKNQPPRLRVGLDKRLAIAFLYIIFVYVIYLVYFLYLRIFPSDWVPYLNLTIYGIDACKCTIYSHVCVIFLINLFVLRRMELRRNINPINLANFTLVISETIHILLFNIHDYLARILEFEPFGAIGFPIFVLWLNFRYFVQINIFYLLCVLHLTAIFAPGFFWKLGTKDSFISLSVPILMALAYMSAYGIFCSCTNYAIPGYYFTFEPTKINVTRIFTILGNVFKGGMFIIVLATDGIIVWKLYRMNLLGQKPVKNERSSRNTTSDNGRNPRAIVTNQQSRLRIGLDKRLVIALLYIIFVYAVYWVYFLFVGIIPPVLVPYLNPTVYGLDACKCTVYVLIVTLK